MQPNYEEMIKKQEQDYQRSRDPFEYGRQVSQRRYSEIMAEIDARRQASQQSYGDLYSQARQRAVRGAAAGGPTLSGGMGQQQRDYVSAIEMQELGRIGSAREAAQRDLFTQAQSAFSNAQLEGQQAEQYARQLEAANAERATAIAGIVGSTKSYDKLSALQKAQLRAYGITDEKSFSEATMISMATQQEDIRQAEREAAIGPTGQIDPKVLQEYLDMLRQQQEENK